MKTSTTSDNSKGADNNTQVGSTSQTLALKGGIRKTVEQLAQDLGKKVDLTESARGLPPKFANLKIEIPEIPK